MTERDFGTGMRGIIESESVVTYLCFQNNQTEERSSWSGQGLLAPMKVWNMIT